MKTSTKLQVLIFAMFLMSGSLFASDDSGSPSDAAFAAGVKETLVGTITSDGAGWSISTVSDTYSLRTGNKPFLDSTGIDLEEGADIFVYGYVADESVVPMLIVCDDAAYFFRDTDGAPLWARAISTRSK